MQNNEADIYLYGCKDYGLSYTVNNIRNILSCYDIKVRERTVQGVSGAFSTRLEIESIEMGVNGKGTSIEMSRASAYGEMMERIQNFALYKFNCPVTDDKNYKGFVYSKDEEQMPYSVLKKECEKLGHNYCASSEKLKMLLSRHEQNNKSFCVTPYSEFATNKKVLVPSMVAEHMYSTNGMAAGNTLEEAIVQGLAEIFERFANKRVCLDGIIPPVIPKEKLNLTSNSKTIIKNINKRGNYYFEFRDCSMGLGLPVVMMIFIDSLLGKYFVKFGCHPIMEVAIERTLTELFQGRTLLSSTLWLQNFSFDKIKNSTYNFEKIYRSGDGKYPYSLFLEKSSYSFSDCWYKDEFKCNKELLIYMYSIIKQNQWNVWYKNLSFMNFPSVHIIIPEISSIIKFDDEYINNILWFRQCRDDVRNISRCSDEQKENILCFLSNMNYASTDSINYLYNLPLIKNTDLLMFNIEYFKYIVLATMGKYEEALQMLDMFIIHNGYMNSTKGTYYRCLREVFSALYIKKRNINEIKEITYKVFGKDTAVRVLYDVQNPEKIIEEITFPCSEVNGCYFCRIKKECKYLDVKKFHNKIVKICEEGWWRTDGQVSI